MMTDRVVRWSPEINLGHVLQALVVIVMLGLAAFPAYINLHSDEASNAQRITSTDARVSSLESTSNNAITAINQLTTKAASTDTRLTDLISAIQASAAAESLRLTSDEQRMDKADAAASSFRSEQREALNQLINSVADLKAAIAHRK